MHLLRGGGGAAALRQRGCAPAPGRRHGRLRCLPQSSRGSGGCQGVRAPAAPPPPAQTSRAASNRAGCREGWWLGVGWRLRKMRQEWVGWASRRPVALPAASPSAPAQRQALDGNLVGAGGGGVSPAAGLLAVPVAAAVGDARGAAAQRSQHLITSIGKQGSHGKGADCGRRQRISASEKSSHHKFPISRLVTSTYNYCSDAAEHITDPPVRLVGGVELAAAATAALAAARRRWPHRGLGGTGAPRQ